MHFGCPDFCINEFHIPKDLFCSNINAELQILFNLQGRWQKKQYIGFVRIPMAINVVRI